MARRASLSKALAAALLAVVALAALLPRADATFGGGDGPFAKHFAKYGGMFGGQQQQQQQPAQQAAPAQAAPTQEAKAATSGGGSGTGCPSVIQVARGNPNFSTLVAALEAAGLAGGPLADPQAVLTVFAPTNAAFGKLIGALGVTPAQLLNRTDLLQTVLKYHVVPGSALKAAQLKNDQRLTTLQGNNVTIRLEGSTVRVIGVSSRAVVTGADVPACKSVIHVIDTVLLPQPLKA